MAATLFEKHPISQTFPQCCLWNSSKTDWRWPFPSSMFVWLTMALSQFHVCLIDDGPFPVPCLSDWRWPFPSSMFVWLTMALSQFHVCLIDDGPFPVPCLSDWRWPFPSSMFVWLTMALSRPLDPRGCIACHPQPCVTSRYYILCCCWWVLTD